MAAIHMRMLGYTVTLAMHAYNLLMTNSLLHGAVMEDPDIRIFTGLHRRFFTVWTMFLQIFVAILGLTSDYLALTRYSNKKEPLWLRLIRGVKNRLFAAILWPVVFLTCTMFWSLFNYDRSLVFPLFADKILSPTANHIVHTAIVPIAVWEVIFQPRSVPKSHGVNITILSVYMFSYLYLMYYTYQDQGVWLYPIFALAYNTRFGFPLIILAIGVAVISYYRMQWLLTRLVWGTDAKLKK